MTALTIREATAADAPLLLHFITELARYEKAEQEVLATEEEIRESLFSETASARALICSQGGEPIGYAVYFFNYSTWLGKNGIYLEDVYITPAKRKSGAGTFVLQHLAKLAVAKGCGRFEWAVLDWNEPAISFYEKIGARPQKEWIIYRLTGQALSAFANGDGAGRD